jgi:prepilin-type N-terminal cleavage/methylation domain-containing protein/prepilin-type processing-associated H-X9-DG protein
MKTWLSTEKGFSLLELLAAVVVTGILTALAMPVVGRGLMEAKRAKCASNMRQLGLAILSYTTDNEGLLPRTTHSTGTMGGRYLNSWIYLLKPYLQNYDQIRVCPADEPRRQQQILSGDFTSYVMNDALDPKGALDEGNSYNRLHSIPFPSQTMMLFILAKSRTPARGWDHIHHTSWTTWATVLEDIEPDRHVAGPRSNLSSERVKGSANYLFADGHVENIPAKIMKQKVEQGLNPAAVPTEQ